MQPTTTSPDVEFIATGLFDPQGIATGVAFYVDSNGLAGLQTGAGGDRRLGLDADGTDGWQFSWNTASETGGVLTVYAQAESSQPVVGGVVAARVLLAEDSTPWRNAMLPADVDASGAVEPLDALLVINYINGHPGSPSLPTAPASPPPYYDVNGDNSATAGDVLTVINHINNRRSGPVSATSNSVGLGVASAEGESSRSAHPSATTEQFAIDARLRLALLGAESESRRRTRTSPMDGRLDLPSMTGPYAARGPWTLNPSDAPVAGRLRLSAPTAALRWPAWTPTKPTDTETELWWVQTEQALSVIASDLAAVSDRR
jgi:hypothetical protein